MKKALILGVTGQDGSYLADILLEKGYLVHGMVRRSATGNTRNIQHLLDDPRVFNKTFFVHRGDMLDPTSLYRVIAEVRPDEIYNEADQDHVRWSFDMVGFSADITGAAVGRLLEIIRQVNPKIRVFQPCSSHMFGQAADAVQTENTPFNPQSVYAIAKTSAFFYARYYRHTFGMHVSVGILYNHESPRRSTEYLTRKVTNAVARIKLGKQSKLQLGDLSAKIDWGFAREYMEVAWAALQQDTPDDYIIATGEVNPVQTFVDEAFRLADLDPSRYIEQDPSLIRPSDTSVLCGDTTKARKRLGFVPKVKMKDLARIMLEADFAMEGGAGA